MSYSTPDGTGNRHVGDEWRQVVRIVAMPRLFWRLGSAVADKAAAASIALPLTWLMTVIR